MDIVWGIFWIEPISKLQIGFEGKASDYGETQHTHEWVRILNRQTTALSGVRRAFEMGSKIYLGLRQ